MEEQSKDMEMNLVKIPYMTEGNCQGERTIRLCFNQMSAYILHPQSIYFVW